MPRHYDRFSRTDNSSILEVIRYGFFQMLKFTLRFNILKAAASQITQTLCDATIVLAILMR